MHAQLPTGTRGAKFDLSHQLWSLMVSVSAEGSTEPSLFTYAIQEKPSI